MQSAVSLAGIKDEPKSQTNTNTKNKRTLYIRMGTYDETVVKTAISLTEDHRGDMPVCFFCNDTKKRILAPEKYWVCENDEVIAKLAAVFGAENVKIS